MNNPGDLYFLGANVVKASELAASSRMAVLRCIESNEIVSVLIGESFRIEGSGEVHALTWAFTHNSHKKRGYNGLLIAWLKVCEIHNHMNTKFHFTVLTLF